MKKKYMIKLALISVFCMLFIAACSKSKSYSELLRDEEKAVNWYMSGQKLVNEIPADSVFITGADAPFYKMDDEGNIYMQVVSPGTPGNKAATDQLIYFRYMRTNIISLYRGENAQPTGNANNVGGNNSTSFRFNNMLISSSLEYGAGVQLPLKFLPIDCEVNVVIRAYYGFNGEAGTCQPYVYNIKYYPAQF